MDRRAIESSGAGDGATRGGHDGDLTRTQVIQLAGNLRDSVAIKRLDEAASRCIQPGRGRLVLDLEAVEESDTRLVAELVTIARRAIKAGVGWQVRASEKIRHWITLYKLDRMLMSGGARRDRAESGVGTDVR